MEEFDVKSYTINHLKSFIRIIKPWKIRQDENDTKTYADGWNDCVKLIGENSKKFIKHIESL